MVHYSSGVLNKRFPTIFPCLRPFNRGTPQVPLRPSVCYENVCTYRVRLQDFCQVVWFDRRGRDKGLAVPFPSTTSLPPLLQFLSNNLFLLIRHVLSVNVRHAATLACYCISWLPNRRSGTLVLLKKIDHGVFNSDFYILCYSCSIGIFKNFLRFRWIFQEFFEASFNFSKKFRGSKIQQNLKNFGENSMKPQ